MITTPLPGAQRRTKTVIATGLMALLATVLVSPAAAAPRPPASAEFTVLARDGSSAAQVEQAVKAAGGTVLERNDAVGLLTAAGPAQGFTDRLSASPSVLAVTTARAVGQAPRAAAQSRRTTVETEGPVAGAAHATPNGARKPAGHRMDPLDAGQWGLASIRADLARDMTIGDRRVKVGIIDTGVEGAHPDIAPNFDRALSRNFARDIPFDERGTEIDGPCEYRGCVDPADVDHGGHGTHVAGVIAAAANGFGLSGVAPGVSVVNVRAGQDSGFFFLQPVVNALTYSADIRLDVVNMSFFVDPWLYNCDNNPADTPAQQTEQRLVKTAMSRALDYAHRKGVTLIASYGNEHTDKGSPKPDVISPNFPLGGEHERQIDNATCQSMPSEHPAVINVAAYGPSGAKADYSTYGREYISVSAPGGYRRDYAGTPRFDSLDNTILSAYSRAGLEHEGLVDAAGTITPAGQAAGVRKLTSTAGVEGFYRPAQGTSMAAPHAAGVAALIISRHGTFRGGDATMAPAKVRRVLEETAIATPCPTPRTVDYLDEGRPADWTATCEGDSRFNGFYGHGQIDAYQAVVGGARLAS